MSLARSYDTWGSGFRGLGAGKSGTPSLGAGSMVGFSVFLLLARGQGSAPVVKIPEVRVKSNISKAQPVFQAPRP